jgi:hypothetical protein
MDNIGDFMRTATERGLTPDEANVEKVRMLRVFLVERSLPASVRLALMGAVKRGYLCRRMKAGERPEVFYHPEFEYLVAGKINDLLRVRALAVAGVCCGAKEIEE